MITENSKMNIKRTLKHWKGKCCEFSYQEHESELDSVLKITTFYHFKKISIGFNTLEITSIEYIFWVNIFNVFYINCPATVIKQTIELLFSFSGKA